MARPGSPRPKRSGPPCRRVDIGGSAWTTMPARPIRWWTRSGKARLRRNFQGYTTDTADALIGFGASAIGRLPHGYVQNAVGLGEYAARISSGDLATVKGYVLTADDRLRADLIERTMCDFAVDVGSVARRHGADPAAVFRALPSPCGAPGGRHPREERPSSPRRARRSAPGEDGRLGFRRSPRRTGPDFQPRRIAIVARPSRSVQGPFQATARAVDRSRARPSEGVPRCRRWRSRRARTGSGNSSGRRHRS